MQTEKRIKTAERKVREAREAEAAKTAEQVQVVENSVPSAVSMRIKRRAIMAGHPFVAASPAS